MVRPSLHADAGAFRACASCGGRRRYLKVLRPLEVDRRRPAIGIYPADEFRVRCYVDFPHPLVGQQEVEAVVRPDTFRHFLARARTFCFERDIEPLRSMGLIRGGSLENAIVLTNDGVMNGPLRFPDEFGRHKALDLIGDLALAGLPLLARVEAHKAGHALHTQLVSRLLADPSLWTIATDSRRSRTPGSRETEGTAVACPLRPVPRLIKPFASC